MAHRPDALQGVDNLDPGAVATTLTTLSLAILIFGFLCLGLEYLAFSKGHLSEDGMLKLFGLTVISTLGVFLVVAGYGQNQIAPVIALLGTAAGYLMGRDSSGKGGGQKAAAASK
jgi:hypothetical protein